MSRNPRLQEFQMDTRLSRRPGKQKFSNFFYNEETGEILGRTPESWGQ